jgi:5S rRNA maturation endonuclease (ribonuclease M5)
MFEILSIIPGKKKLTNSKWHSFNAPCCHNRGHKADRRMRGGIIFDGPNKWTMNCFNCGFKCAFTLGRSLTKNTKQLLSWCGVDPDQITKWNFESLQHKDLLDFTNKRREKKKVKFKETQLPDGELLDVNNPTHKVYIDYLQRRGITINEYPFLVTPNAEGRYNNRIIIPYTFNNKIVGHTSRFLDNRMPKFINEQQPGYLFGYDLQKADWQVCIVVEGIFDALSINGCALMHNTISEEQITLLNNLHRKIIVVPDQDKAGLEICDKALELGFSVSLPNWEVKDVNDAVIKYGKTATMLSILQSETTSKIKIEMRKKAIDKRL